jgi:hypothetical protein
MGDQELLGRRSRFALSPRTISAFFRIAHREQAIASADKSSRSLATALLSALNNAAAANEIERRLIEALACRFQKPQSRLGCLRQARFPERKRSLAAGACYWLSFVKGSCTRPRNAH